MPAIINVRKPMTSFFPEMEREILGKELAGAQIDVDELEVHRAGKMSRKVGGEESGALEDADQHDRTVFVVLRDVACERVDALLDALLEGRQLVGRRRVGGGRRGLRRLGGRGRRRRGRAPAGSLLASLQQAPDFGHEQEPVVAGIDPAVAKCFLVDIEDYTTLRRDIERAEEYIRSVAPDAIAFGRTFDLGPSKPGKIEALILTPTRELAQQIGEEMDRLAEFTDPNGNPGLYPYSAATYNLTVQVGDGTSTSTETVTVNLTDVAPTITAGQTFSVSEAAANGTGVGSVATTGDAPTTFTITAGNTGTAFAIDNAGNVTVNDATQLDFDTAPATYALTADGKTVASATYGHYAGTYNENITIGGGKTLQGAGIGATIIDGTSRAPIAGGVLLVRDGRIERVGFDSCIDYKNDSLGDALKLLCPAGIDVPNYVAAIADGDYAKSVEIIRERNPFPAVCGRICIHPCEYKCRRGELDQPVAIRALKRLASDWYFKNIGPQRDPFPVTRKEKVAVVGAGPGGLGAARRAAERGRRVTRTHGIDANTA